MGAPIVVNTVKVQGTVTSNPAGTAAIIGTVSQNATWNVNAAQTGGWTVSVSEAYDFNSGVNSPFKVFPMGGSSNMGGWVPLGVDDTSGVNRLLTSTIVGGSVETYTNGISTVSSNEAVANNASSSGFSGSVFPVGIVDRFSSQRTHLEKDSGGLLVSGTVDAHVSGTVTIPNSAPAYVAGTITASNNAPAYVAGTTTVTNAASGALYTQGTVSVAGTANTIERGSAIAHGSAAISSSAQILAASGTRRTAVLTNLGTDYIWLGASGVASGSGLRLAPGQTAVIDRAPQAAIHGVAQSGTQSVAYFTESD